MQPRLQLLPEKKLVGMYKRMSFAAHEPRALWQALMPRRKEITNRVGNALYSLEVYDSPDFFINFSPTALFTKWAAVEVTDYSAVPEGMDTLLIPAGWYALFIHHGPNSDAAKTYNDIFETWLPASGYLLHHRPHVAVMGDKYKANDAASEEEIWIPVVAK